MLLWWLAWIEVAQSPINSRTFEGQVVASTLIQIGAFPGQVSQAVVDFSAWTSSIPRVARRWSPHIQTADADMLYLNGRAFWVNTSNSSAGPAVVGMDLLTHASSVWGVCDGRLYLSRLPRHCRRGAGGVRRCGHDSCGINWNISHGGRCSEGYAPVTFGTYAMSVPCEATDFLGEPRPLVVERVQGELSMVRAGLQFEFNADLGEVRVWERVRVTDDTMSLVAMSFFAMSLAAWLSWTRGLNAAVTHGTLAALDDLWDRLARSAMFVGDCMWLAAGVKTYQFAVDAVVFMPECLDRLLGHHLALLYCVWYVGVVLMTTLSTFYLLLVTMSHCGHTLPACVVRAIRPAVRQCDSPAHRVCVLVAVRWMFETVLLSALHIMTPTTIGYDFQLAVGLTTGVVMAAVAGRDAFILMRESRATGPRLLVVGGLLSVLVHVATFMVYPSVAGVLGDVNRVAATISVTISAEVAAASALFHSRAKPLPGSDSPRVDASRTRKGLF